MEFPPLRRLRDTRVVVCEVGDRPPVLADAVREAVLAIEVQAHHPVDGEEGADCPLKLVTDGAAGGYRVARADLAHVQGAPLVEEVEVQLREADEVVVELLQRIPWIQDARRNGSGPDPVGGQPVHAGPEHAARRIRVPLAAVQPLLHGRETLCGRRGKRHPPDQQQILEIRIHQLLLLGGLRSRRHRLRHRGVLADLLFLHAAPCPDVELRAYGQAMVVLLPVEVEITLCGSELLALWQADHLHSRMQRVGDPEGHLVYAVHRVQARVAIALHIVFDNVLIAVLLLNQVQVLPRRREPQAFVQRRSTACSPILREGADFRSQVVGTRVQVLGRGLQPRELSQRHLLSLDGLPVVHELHSGEERVVHTEDLSDQPDLHEPGDALQSATRHADDDATPLRFDLPKQVLD
mmetsp:Transcript_12755/g.41245  ORF Transcript_12755/g.41245 Transcript_12755/m.41245 type:complete len:408 (+) Transcript_12755:1447-2670(+)